MSDVLQFHISFILLIDFGIRMGSAGTKFGRLQEKSQKKTRTTNHRVGLIPC